MGRLGKKVHLMKPLDVDKIPIRRDRFYAKAYVIELPLDSQPDYVWQTIFEQEWKSSLHFWERKVVILGDRLLLITTPTELEEKIDWLKRVIESTNMGVERFNRTQKILREVKTGESRRHVSTIRDALRRRLAPF